jgi:hypothetical protein
MPETPAGPAPLLPELARSLRSLGSPRDAATEAAHAAIFMPLLDARSRAAGTSVDAVLSALRGDALSARIEAQAVDAAVQGIVQPAMARALTAQTSELIEPLRAELLKLDDVAPAARDEAEGWHAWVAQLRRVFHSADVACQSLARLLANRDTQTAAPRWFERTPK